MTKEILFEIAGEARICRDFLGIKFERFDGRRWATVGYGPLMGLTKGQARACRKALRKHGLFGHLRRSLLRSVR